NLAETQRLLRSRTDLAKRAHFFNHTGGEHCFGPLVDALVKLRAIACQNRTPPAEDRLGPLLQMLRIRPACEQTNLERTDDAAGIAQIDLPGTLRIEFGESACKIRERRCGEFRPEVGRSRRKLGESTRERPNIET